MTVFINQGDAPMTEAQIIAREQAYLNHDWTPQAIQMSLAASDGKYQAALDKSAMDGKTNRANNSFNQKLVDYNKAKARLAQYELYKGHPAITQQEPELDANGQPVMDKSGNPVMQTVTISPAVDPLPATVTEPVYDQTTGKQTGTKSVPNPEITKDEGERASAQAVINATPTAVSSWKPA